MIVFSPSKELLIITFWNSSVLTQKKTILKGTLLAGFLHLNMGIDDYNGMFYYLDLLFKNNVVLISLIRIKL